MLMKAIVSEHSQYNWQILGEIMDKSRKNDYYKNQRYKPERIHKQDLCKIEKIKTFLST